jgi:O-antigen ligase
MFLSIKELIVILVIAIALFRLAKPIALEFMTADDFSRRRNLWFILTAVAFLTPSFWLYALIAIPLLIRAGRKDSNPSALYLMLLHVIPPIDVPVPMIGMPYIVLLNNYLLLSLCVMTPAAFHLLRSKAEDQISGLKMMDYCLLAYIMLTAVLFVHFQTPSGGLFPATFTDSLRRVFVLFFSTFVPYFVISRSTLNRRAILDTLATFCLSCALLAAIAIFEGARHWLLYGEMAERWGYGINFTLYLTRGASLRAIASTGHPLALGHLLVIAFGFWLYLQYQVKSGRSRFLVAILYWLGLLAAYSRGPWIAAVLVYFVFAAVRPRAVSKLIKAAAVGMIVVIFIGLTPLRDKVINVLPFMGGTIDSENVIYRHRLFDRAWQIIQESPVLGDQAALLKMQDLRQGQGIIDLVNSYLQVLLDNGFVGLSLFLSFILIALFKAWKVSKKSARIAPDFSMLGASLVACILGTLLLMENGSFGTGTERIFYALAALALAYAHIGPSMQRKQLGGHAVNISHSGKAPSPR